MGDRLRRLRRPMLHVAAVLLGAFLIIQLVPYGWQHSNPPVVNDAPWPDERAAAIARQSCYSCHSNETDWPAYSYVAPMSWLVRRDVDQGRAAMNFSEWDPEDNEADDAIELIEDGAMPPSQYTLVHRDARLTAEEQQTLIAALERLEEGDDGSGRGRGRGGDDDGRDADRDDDDRSGPGD